MNKEVKVEELLRKTIPNSLVSQKCPSLNFSFSSTGSQNESLKSKQFPKIKIIKKKKIKVKDYKITPQEKPLNIKNLNKILFKVKIKDAPFR